MLRLKIENAASSAWVRFTAVAIALIAGAGRLMAQSQDGFVPATGITKESLPAGPLLYSAYAIVWLVLIAYVFLLWRRLGRVEKELSEVSARIAGGKRS